MGDNLAELLYMAWRSSLLSSTLTASDDLPSWGNVRDPDVRGAWEAAATKAKENVRAECAMVLDREVDLHSVDNMRLRWIVQNWAAFLEWDWSPTP